MTRNEFDKLYLDKVIHCDTEEKANHFLALADSVGYMWNSGRRLIKENMWEEYEKETCYLVTDDGFTFCNKNHFVLNGYQIIEYQPQLKFKVGDKVRVKNTSYIVLNGKVGIIVNVDASLMPYAVRTGIDELWYLNENELEKIEEQPKFKVGDKVRIKNTPHITINDKVGVIERADSLSIKPYAVKIYRDSWLWFLAENELEKIEETTYKEETINNIIEEIKENQKRITVLFNRLEQELKNK